MSDVKHQPATPLPWTTLEDGRARVKLVHVETTHDNDAGAGLPVCSINRTRIGDAEYLTHASNAYPKLVEALGGLDLHCGFDLLNPCFDNRPTDVSGQHWGVGKACRGCTARALLRDLGEAP